MGKRRAGAITLGVLAGVAAAGVAAERAWVRRDRRRPDRYALEPYGSARGKPAGPVTSFDGTLIHVEEVGDGPAILLSHGFSLNSTLWHHQLTELSDTMRVIVHDHRGHGLSGMPPSDDWSLEALARDLDAVIEATVPAGERVIVAGHSMGGMALLTYASIFPEKIGPRVAGMILVDTTAADVMGGMVPGIGRRVQAAFQAVQEAATRAIAGRAERLDTIRRGGTPIAYLGTRLMGFGPNPSPSQVDFIERLLSECPSDVWVKLIPSILGLDVAEALPAIDVPVLIVVGTHDRLTPPGAAERMASVIPGAQLVVIEDAGHSPMLEKHEDFNAEVLVFAARALAAQGT